MRKYIPQATYEDFVYPNNNVAVYDVNDVVQDINSNEITGTITGFTTSTSQGLGTLGYISSIGPTQLAVTSTSLGLGTLGYLSSRIFNLQSTFFVNAGNATSLPSYGTFTVKTGFSYTGAPWRTQTAELQVETNSFSQVVLDQNNQTLIYSGSNSQVFRITYTCGGNQNEVSITRPALTMQVTSGGSTKTYQTVNNIESAGASVTNGGSARRVCAL
jgi:hypothetical protein